MRALVALLLLANLGFFALARGWLAALRRPVHAARARAAAPGGAAAMPRRCACVATGAGSVGRRHTAPLACRPGRSRAEQIDAAEAARWRSGTALRARRAWRWLPRRGAGASAAHRAAPQPMSGCASSSADAALRAAAAGTWPPIVPGRRRHRPAPTCSVGTAGCRPAAAVSARRGAARSAAQRQRRRGQRQQPEAAEGAATAAARTTTGGARSTGRSCGASASAASTSALSITAGQAPRRPRSCQASLA